MMRNHFKFLYIIKSLFLKLGFLFTVLLLASCSKTLQVLQTDLLSNEIVKSCASNSVNKERCLVDQEGAYIYESEYGGRISIGKSILGNNGASSLLLPVGWYDGTTKITFTEANLISSNANRIRSGYNLFGIDGTLVTSLPSECLSEKPNEGQPGGVCSVLSAKGVQYAYLDEYGGRNATCTLGLTTKVNSACWITVDKARVNSSTSIIDNLCTVADMVGTTGLVNTQCTAVTNKFWYDKEFGGRQTCSAVATELKNCWLNIPSGSVTLADAGGDSSVNRTCVDASDSGFNNSSPCKTPAGTWYVYSSLYGGRSTLCSNDNTGNCYFNGAFNDIEPNLKSENIRLGYKIFGVSGSFEGEGVWASAAHRSSDTSPITFNSEAGTYRDKINLPSGYRSVSSIYLDDEGASTIAEGGVQRSEWNSTCGINDTITKRIEDCNKKFDLNSVWTGSTEGNAGQGTWKLVTRAGNKVAGIYREIWRDEKTGMLWSSVLSKTINWCQAAGVFGADISNICNQVVNQIQAAGSDKAISACATGADLPSLSDLNGNIDLLAKGKTASTPLDVEWRLPTLYDYEIADYNGIRYVMPDMSINGSVEWTATTNSTTPSKAWVFDSKNGASEVRDRNDSNVSVRCIGRGVSL